MRFVVTLSQIIFLMFVAALVQGLSAEFQQWRSLHKKQYISAQEEAYRFQVFLANAQHISTHNSNSTHTYELGLNHLSDMSQEEFAKTYLIAQPPDPSLAANVKFEGPAKRRNLQQATSSVDWEALGLCTVPKNMYNCAASWIFAATGAIECLVKIANGASWAMSEQQIMNCTVGGCGYGDIYSSYNYTAVLGVYNNTYFGYVGIDGVCKKAGGPMKISNFTSWEPGCNNLKIALQTRPVSVYVDSSNWMSYKTGIISSVDSTGSCGAALGNYFAVLVGYSDTYWKLRNSFGRYWGENGYIRIAQGNTCFICDRLFYTPVL